MSSNQSSNNIGGSSGMFGITNNPQPNDPTVPTDQIQSYIELQYIAAGNTYISNKMNSLANAVQLTNAILGNLSQLQQLHNLITIPSSGAFSLPPDPGGNSRYGTAFVANYVSKASAFFNRIISPNQSTTSKSSLFVTRLNSIATQLSSQLAALKSLTGGQRTDLQTRLEAVLANLDNPTTGSATNLTPTLKAVYWLADGFPLTDFSPDLAVQANLVNALNSSANDLTSYGSAISPDIENFNAFIKVDQLENDPFLNNYKNTINNYVNTGFDQDQINNLNTAILNYNDALNSLKQAINLYNTDVGKYNSGQISDIQFALNTENNFQIIVNGFNQVKSDYNVAKNIYSSYIAPKNADLQTSFDENLSSDFKAMKSNISQANQTIQNLAPPTLPLIRDFLIAAQFPQAPESLVDISAIQATYTNNYNTRLNGQHAPLTPIDVGTSLDSPLNTFSSPPDISNVTYNHIDDVINWFNQIIQLRNSNQINDSQFSSLTTIYNSMISEINDYQLSQHPTLSSLFAEIGLYNTKVTTYNTNLANYNAFASANNLPSAGSPLNSLITGIPSYTATTPPLANVTTFEPVAYVTSIPQVTSTLSANSNVSGNKGAIQNNLNFAITSSQSLNTTQQQNVQSFEFVFQQFYQSASAILTQLNQIIRQMAQNISK